MTAHAMTTIMEIEAGDLALYRAAVNRHAEVTRQREAGCLRFDVSFGADRQTLCLLYAIFEDGDALDYHLASDHYHMFQDLTAEWVISRVEQFWELGASPRLGGATVAV